MEHALKNTADALLCGARALISSPWFAAVTAVYTLVCYYMGWDVAMIWYMALAGSFILLFVDDVTPLITLFLFMNIMISMKNSPTTIDGNSNQYYFQTHVLAQIGVGVALFAGSGVYRGIREVLRGRFKPSPAFYSLVALSVAMLLNGAFAPDYVPFTLVYGFFLAFLFIVPFVVCSSAVKFDEEAFKRVAWAFIALAACLVVELVVAYCTYDGLWLEDGTINRGKLYFGWGVYNTMGMLFVISMPAAAYLGIVYKGRLSCLCSAALVLIMLASFATMSRQAIVCGFIVFALCVAWLMAKCADRWLNGGTMLCMAALALVAFIVKIDFVYDVWRKLTNDFFDGSGRIELYKKAFAAFLSCPLFGTGFCTGVSDPVIGLPIMPFMYHDTVFQLIGASGAFGLAAYVWHRVHTIISFAKNPSAGRTFIALSLAALLLLNLFDNHIFYLLPTLVFSFLTAVLVASENSSPLRVFE